MQKRDLRMVCPRPRRFIDESNPGRFQLCQPVLDAADRVGDVVQPFAAFLNKRGHAARRIARLEQLQPHVGQPEKTDPHLLARHVLHTFKRGPQDLFVERALLFDGPHSDADVVDGLGIYLGSVS